MKKIVMLLLFAGLFATAVFADGDMPVQEHQLPDAARGFIRKYFEKIQVVSATKDTGIATSYEVRFADGSSVDFNARGEWTEIERPHGVVPGELIPEQIHKYIAQNNPGAQVTTAEREGKGYKIWLDNGLGLRFDRRFRMIGLDD